MQIAKREITSLDLDGSYLDMRKQDIQNMIEGNWDLTNHEKEETYIKFDKSTEFFILKGQDIILFFSDLESRDKALELYNQNYKSKGLFSEEIEKGIQSPQVIGPFDYNGRIGLWVNAKNQMNDSTNIERGIYKGIIVNPSKYFEVKNEVEKSSEIINTILG